MIKSISRNLKLSKSPRHNEQILALAMRQIEKMLQEMQNEGKDLLWTVAEKIPEDASYRLPMRHVRTSKKKERSPQTGIA